MSLRRPAPTDQRVRSSSRALELSLSFLRERDLKTKKKRRRRVRERAAAPDLRTWRLQPRSFRCSDFDRPTGGFFRSLLADAREKTKKGTARTGREKSRQDVELGPFLRAQLRRRFQRPRPLRCTRIRSKYSSEVWLFPPFQNFQNVIPFSPTIHLKQFPSNLLKFRYNTVNIAPKFAE